MNHTVTSKFLAYTTLPFDQKFCFPLSYHLCYVVSCFHFVWYLKHVLMKCLIQCLVIIRLPLKALVLQCKNSVTQQQVHVPFIPFEKYSIFLLFFLVGLKMDPCFSSIAARYVWLFILMCDYCTCLSWLCQKLKTFPYVNWRWRSHLQLYEGVDVKVLKCSNQSLLVVVHTVKTCSSPSWPRILRFPVVFTFLCVVF